MTSSNDNGQSTSVLHASHTSMPKRNKCFFCKSAQHDTQACKASLSIEDKKKRLAKQRRCYRCTMVGHRSKECRRNIRCRMCKGRHATAMCDPHYACRMNKDEKHPTSNFPVQTQATKSKSSRQQVMVGVLQTKGLRKAHTNADIHNACITKTVNTTHSETLGGLLEQQSTTHDRRKDTEEQFRMRTIIRAPEKTILEEQHLCEVTSSQCLRQMSDGSASIERDNHTTRRSWSRKPAVTLKDSLEGEPGGSTTKKRKQSARGPKRQSSLNCPVCRVFA